MWFKEEEKKVEKKKIKIIKISSTHHKQAEKVSYLSQHDNKKTSKFNTNRHIYIQTYMIKIM